MKKSIIFLCVFFGLFTILLIITNINESNLDDKEVIKARLEDKGFLFDEESDCYRKSVSGNTLDDYYDLIKKDKKSEYEELYFYLDQQRLNLDTQEYENVYYLNKVKMQYEGNIYRNYSSDYNLVDKLITYKYEVTMYSSTMILSGTYNEDKEEFTCEIASNKDMNESSKDTFCTRAKYENVLFLQQIKELINNPEFTEVIYGK